MPVGARRLVPHALRRQISARLEALRARRVDGELAELASGSATIVAGPWLGEVGFELLYWVPFLAWFAERFDVARERLVVVSRGGTAAWYPFAGSYREIFDRVEPAAFRRLQEARVAANGEQKQTRVLEEERDLLRDTVGGSARLLHPSIMYRLYAPFWWGHVNERWVHRRARYHQLRPAPAAAPRMPARPYVAVKFYFNECFPPTDANRAFVHETVARLASQGPVVSLETGVALDDHGAADAGAAAIAAPHLDARDNLAVQSAIVAGASSFVGTYGGFSYLAPLCGVPAAAYYSDDSGFSRRHLLMARSALASLGTPDLLDVIPVTGS